MSDTVEKFNALEGATEYVVPHTWDPGHVAYRLIKGFEVLRSLPAGRLMPAGPGNAWPVMLQEFSELADEEAKMYAREAFAENVRPRYTSEEIDRAQEALAWCLHHLNDHPQRADAVQLWSYSKASGCSLNKLLRERSKSAAQAARLATQRENLMREKKRKAIMGSVLNTTNMALALAPPSEHADIRNAAIIAYRERVVGLEDILLTANDMVPGRILTRTTLDRHLQPGLQCLSNRLAQAGVPCR